MSNPEPNPQVAAWLQQGIDAARAGDKVTARTLLEQVVQFDQRNERGWFWLAAAVDDIGEKKVCLGNVLTINPANERAQNLLKHLQAIELGEQPTPIPQPAGVEFEAQSDDPFAATGAVSPAMPAGTDKYTAFLEDTNHSDSRTIWYVAAALGAVATIVLIIVLVMMMGGDDDSANQENPPANVGQNSTQSASNSTSGDTLPTEPAASPNITPTPSRTPPPPLPTWTPKPSNTPISAVPSTLFPPAPATLGGKIIMRSGNVIGDQDNQPITIINPDGSNRQTLTGSDRGHTPSLSPDGNRFVYIKYAVSTFEHLMQLDNLQGTAPQLGSSYWNHTIILRDFEQPTWSPDGNFMAFTANSGAASPDLYRLSLLDPTGANPDALQRLTQDNAIESWPAFSPDGQFIVYAADLSPVTSGEGTELRIYVVADGSIGNLTTNGAALIEAAPDWSPDASQIVFQGQEAPNAPADIYLIPAIGGEPQKIIESDSNDIQPRFSPDGQYIVFSSDRSGNWDVFIYELATQTVYQVTTDKHTDIANDWGR
ncbi:MAG: PD40 domain-containing protein [Anaerolineae bacterium]|nr:PD40 domain-containing protein [Anaerolineae bacterium]